MVGIAPDVDERALDDWLVTRGPAALAVELASRKLADVLARRPADLRGLPVVAADQVGVLLVDGEPTMLTKRGDHAGAVAQLRRLSGTTHELVNGLAVSRLGRMATGVDVQRVTFRDLSDDEIDAYVERARPFDTAGSYRLEDDAPGRRPPGSEPFVVEVVGEDPSGVLGLPIPLLDRLLAQVGATGD